jgi:hypothetical protein
MKSIATIAGLNEGLAILEALISHQWDTLWPKTQHARMEILSGLSQRLQQRMRMLPFNSSHLSELYRAEALLTSLSRQGVGSGQRSPSPRHSEAHHQRGTHPGNKGLPLSDRHGGCRTILPIRLIFLMHNIYPFHFFDRFGFLQSRFAIGLHVHIQIGRVITAFQPFST